ncbi:hypothetical protein Pmani_027157 [Petrolisthes manimaculis]|uniref:MULE transposase domain-containing protein n=1 Tax=Petrolisthes manimaculis TaxID=1843537 RepID=A0AAE1P3A2_9EUCA|nr:hypothetical protein Pmani_027157 [Petrolisthes manimaculis]
MRGLGFKDGEDLPFECRQCQRSQSHSQSSTIGQPESPTTGTASIHGQPESPTTGTASIHGQPESPAFLHEQPDSPTSDSACLDRSAPVLSDISSLNGSFAQPLVPEEPLIEDPIPHTSDTEPEEITWQVIKGATQRGGAHLINSAGFTYVKQKVTKTSTVWICSKRNKTLKCAARVHQRGQHFCPTETQHNHPSAPDALTSAKVRATLKESLTSHQFTAGSALVTDAVHKHVTVGAPCPSLPTQSAMIRVANRRRQGIRPKHPTDLSFDLKMDAIPEDFLQADITVGPRRHLLYSSPHQLKLLAAAKTWYMDGTFRLVKAPFTQLYSIHAFIRSEHSTKQFPLAFIIMSGKKEADYKAVLKVLLDIIPEPSVSKVVLDFEAAVWKAVKQVLPHVIIQGCAFHFSQAIWRKIQELGLQQAYNRKQGTYMYCRRLMALAFLPSNFIISQFEAIRDATPSNSPLQPLLEYFYCQWIQNPIFDVSSWCIYMQPIRTNNNCEGWHNRLGSKAGRQQNLNLYKLIHLLNNEAKEVSLNVQLLSDGRLKHYQSKECKKTYTIIHDAWERLQKGDISIKKVLKIVAYVNGPRPKV